VDDHSTDSHDIAVVEDNDTVDGDDTVAAQ
jgi:hypothetical protein